MMKRKGRPHLWFLSIAVLAIAGMVSTAGAACGMKDGQAPRACCADRPAPERGCCDSKRPAPPAADAVAFVLMADSSSCDCRASDPAAPADHQNRASTDRLETDGFGPFAAAAPSAGPPPRIDLSTLPTERPPKVPLYLQTSRLLN